MVGRERAIIWEEVPWVRRRTGMELAELISEAIKRRLDREITAMAFKGGKPGKGSGDGKGKDQADVLAMYRELVRIQSEVIHALAAALATTEADDGDEDEEDENEENDEEKEEDK